MNVIQKEREKKIIEILSNKRNVTMETLRRMLNVSISTLRRDIIALEAANVVRNSRGRVNLLQNSNIEFAYAIRRQANEDIKNKICRRASKEVTNNQAIFLDASSTLAFLPKYLASKKNLHVITNSIHIALEVNHLKNIKLSILGGEIAFNSDAVLGGGAINTFNKFYRPDICILSCSSINSHGFFMADEEQAILKRTALENSKKSILLVDHTKFDKSDYILLSTFDNKKVSQIITDILPSPNIQKSLKKAKIELLIAN